jgi:hypothetical protein
MKTYSYKPFKEELSVLKGPELVALKEVSEGWFVDYKVEPPNAKNLARHLAAFANERGGWLFIGVQEDERGGMTAGSFPGIPSGAVDSALVQLREASSAHLSPQVFFEQKVIHGPVSEIGLPSDQAVIIVGIPEGNSPPYVHSSGQIYRRVADQSTPKPETDRGVLDHLWNRGQRTRDRLRDFLTDLPQLSEAEKTGPARAYVYFLPSLDFSGDRLNLTFREFAEVMSSGGPGKEGISVPFDNIFTTTDGFLARQTKDNDPLLAGLSFRWWSDGRAVVHIPINVYDFGEVNLQLDPMQKEFLQILRDHGYQGGRVAEMSLFGVALAATTDKYLLLRQKAGTTGSFFGKVRLCGTWRLIPFLNFRPYLEAIKKYGFPVIQDESMYCPPGTSKEFLVELSEHWEGDPKLRCVVMAFSMVCPVLQGVGIPIAHLSAELGNQVYVELVESMQDSLRQKPVR